MLDIKLFREKPELIQKDLAKRGLPTKTMEEVIKKDEEWREKLNKVQEQRHQKNMASRKIAELKQKNKDASKEIKEMQSLDKQMKKLEQEVKTLKEKETPCLCKYLTFLMKAFQREKTTRIMLK